MLKKIGNIIAKVATNGIGAPAEGIVNTALSLVRDKTTDAETSFIREKVRNGVSISSKRMLNIGVTTSIITIALFLIQTNGVTKLNMALIGIGVIYSLGMSFITAWKERQ